MINVSDSFKLQTKKIKHQHIKLGILGGELTVKEVNFMTVKQFNALPVWLLRKRKEVIAKELRYSFEGSLFKTIMKQIEITVKNAGELKDKNVNFQYGLYINNDYEYIDLGDYYIKDIEDDKGKKELVVTGYDKMINFMKTFKQSDLQLTYPCTMLALIQKMCEVCGVELYSTDFFHADLQVDEDYFTAQELTYRDVLEKVAESTLTTIFIKDNKLYLHKLANTSVEKLDASFLSGLTIKEKFGPLNALVLGRGSVEDNIEAKDDSSIAQNGRCEIRFDENEFVEYQREQVIDKMFEQIKGLEYYAYESSDLGVMWLEPCDLIELEDSENNIYQTIYLKANITINTGISSDIEADIPEETNTEYKVTTKEEKKTLKVERLAKKNEGLIQDLIEETSENSQKLSQHEQTIDSISDKVESIQDLTQTVEGTKTITLANCVEGDLLELHIYGNNNVFKYLYPSDTLFPSDTLYPYGDSRIVVTDENNNSTTYELGVTDTLRKNGDVCDEYILEGGKAKVIRRINKDGTIKSSETIEDLGEYVISLKNGTNKITIKNYTATIKAKYAIQNDYTEIFSTKVETKTAIEQTAEDIDISVNKKLENYSTTTEMNSAINLKANEINQKVEKKVDEETITGAYLVLKINDDESGAKLKAVKVDINAEDVLNILAGNTLNLTSKNININSDTLNIDSNGNMTLTGEENVANIKIVLGTNKNRYITINPARLVFTNNSTGNEIVLYNAPNGAWIQLNSGSRSINILNDGKDFTRISLKDSANETIVDSTGITTPTLTQTSRVEAKKNFEKLTNALEIIKNTDIYKYNLKSQNDGDKKHIGFVIGEDYKYASEITSINGNREEIGANIYSMVSVAYKAIQEQQEQIKKLQNEIEVMKGEQNG